MDEWKCTVVNPIWFDSQFNDDNGIPVCFIWRDNFRAAMILYSPATFDTSNPFKAGVENSCYRILSEKPRALWWLICDSAYFLWFRAAVYNTYMHICLIIYDAIWDIHDIFELCICVIMNYGYP